MERVNKNTSNEQIPHYVAQHQRYFSQFMGGETRDERRANKYDEAVNHRFDIRDVVTDVTIPNSLMEPPGRKLTIAQGSLYAFKRLSKMKPRMRYGSKESKDGNCLFTGKVYIPSVTFALCHISPNYFSID